MKVKVILLAAALCAAVACNQSTNLIKTKVPARPAGQENVIGLTADPIENVRIGVIGLGMRGSFAVERLSYVPGSQITAVCDLLPERVEWAQNTLKALGNPDVAGYGGEEESWKQVCESPDVDLVYIVTDWKHHTPMALYAMDCGKHVAIEVPAALDMDEIWALINKSEQTRL
ncbi:MAG: Gfo/Idh/MocA family oxidoreductase, partial [Bacteroidales bacterium]|nr:Gfo/Idh/MocA family oxidoreductase [Bacteroidales bacterium]